MSAKRDPETAAARWTLEAPAILLAAPVLVVAGWTWLIANAGRGADDSWAIGHLVLFVANAFWVPALLVLRACVPVAWRRSDDVALGLVIFGSLCVAGQLAVDLVAWALALDASSLRPLFTAVRAQPALLLLFYLVGPLLLFMGVFIGSLRLIRAGGRYRTGGALVAAGLVVVAVGALTTFSVVTAAGYVLVLVGFVLVARAIAARPDARLAS